MQSSRGVTGTLVGIACALLFGAVAMLALGFQLGGYQNPALIKYCYILAAILLLATPVALFWHWVKRWRPFTLAPVDKKGSESALAKTAVAYATIAKDQLAEGNVEGFKNNVFALYLETLSESVFQIERASADKGKLVVALKDSEGNLHPRDTLIVVDTEDWYPMGEFEVTEKRTGECYATGVKDVDSLWLGDMMQRKETNMVMHKVALLVKRNAEQ